MGFLYEPEDLMLLMNKAKSRSIQSHHFHFPQSLNEPYAHKKMKRMQNIFSK